MEVSKYLPIGSTVANKYEIVDILGEDDFEILYLVRDFQRKTSFFVLKELFLETFSVRNGVVVITIPEAEGVFNKRKQQIIEEIESKKLNLDNNDIKIYGYEEENNTIYTLMEFSNNANLDKYLQFVPNKGVSSLPALNELIAQPEEKSRFPFYLKVFFFLVTLFVAIFYGYQYFQKRSMNHQEVVVKKVDSRKIDNEVQFVEQERVEIEEPLVEEVLISEIDNNSSIEETFPTVSVPVEKIVVDEINMSIISQNEPLVKVIEEKNLSQVIPIVVKELPVESIEVRIKEFLDVYIDSSSSKNISNTLKYYDTRVKRYFKFRNATHNTIRKSIQRYNKKWSKRNFKISKFKIVKRYKKKGITYFDVKTTTTWKVVSKRGKKLSGKSKGRMILKETKDGFKIVSIVTIK